MGSESCVGLDEADAAGGSEPGTGPAGIPWGLVLPPVLFVVALVALWAVLSAAGLIPRDPMRPRTCTPNEANAQKKITPSARAKTARATRNERLASVESPGAVASAPRCRRLRRFVEP